MSSESVWFEQVDEALIRFIKSHINIDGRAVKAVVRKPDEDFKEEDYPLVSIYNLSDTFARDRYSPEQVVVSTDIERRVAVVEDSALPYDLSYQIDFWASKQSDMNSMTKQWKLATGLWFNLDVFDESYNKRSCFVKSLKDFRKSDLMSSGKRLFHSFGTYKIWVELDERKSTEVPIVVSTPDINIVSQ